MENTKVSIICLVFNHEPYLRRCLDGFVNQKTNFKYEVIIHDDASKDSSAQIIKEYELKYPEIIKPIYQQENQFSKGVDIINDIMIPKAVGKYIAWCEGDDYWIDEFKLQKQVEFLEKHDEYSACYHRAKYINLINNTEELSPNIVTDTEFDVNQIIKRGGSIFATNSCVIRADIYRKMPKCFDAQGFSDYQIFMYSAIVGKIVCLHDVMSVYNHGTVGSWTLRTKSNDKMIQHLNELIRMLNEVNMFYQYKYNDAIQYKINESKFQMDCQQASLFKLLLNKNNVYFLLKQVKAKLLFILRKYFPILKEIKDKLRGGKNGK